MNELETKARQVRRLIVQMLEKAGSGHPGGSLSSADIMSVLFFHVLRHDARRPRDPNRDRFHLSKGHCCPVWYAVLSECGYFPQEELWNLRRLGAMLQGHPDTHVPGVDVASGSLGQGLSVALGMSLAAKIDARTYRVYCLLGDGEIQEGNVWEAAMAAAHYRCDNLCAVLDYNGFQIDGRVEEVMNIEPIADKWRAFGWHTVVVDGHSIQQLVDAFAKVKGVGGKPSMIIAKTVKGKAVSFMEHVVDFHGRVPTKEEAARALQELSDER
ncbi:MAG: transketolase [Candidatus Omnitrophica bacterium]|nr:transketolase [Candidatus Omnitrophota bacterium]